MKRRRRRRRRNRVSVRFLLLTELRTHSSTSIKSRQYVSTSSIPFPLFFAPMNSLYRERILKIGRKLICFPSHSILVMLVEKERRKCDDEFCQKETKEAQTGRDQFNRSTSRGKKNESRKKAAKLFSPPCLGRLFQQKLFSHFFSSSPGNGRPFLKDLFAKTTQSQLLLSSSFATVTRKEEYCDISRERPFSNVSKKFLLLLLQSFF